MKLHPQRLKGIFITCRGAKKKKKKKKKIREKTGGKEG